MSHSERWDGNVTGNVTNAGEQSDDSASENNMTFERTERQILLCAPVRDPVGSFILLSYLFAASHKILAFNLPKKTPVTV